MKLSFLFFTLALAYLKLDFDIYSGNDNNELIDEQDIKDGAVFKRQDFQSMVLDNDKLFYVADLKFGQKQVPIRVLVDIGSSDLWVHAHNVLCLSRYPLKREQKEDLHYEEAEEPEEKQQELLQEPIYKVKLESKQESKLKRNQDFEEEQEVDLDVENKIPIQSQTYDIGYNKAATTRLTNTCTSFGTFNTADSDSFHSNESAPAFENSIQWSVLPYAKGNWGYDSVFLNDVKIENVTFAVVDYTNMDMGVLGLGLPITESTYDFNAKTGYQYENFPMNLKSQGIIKKTVYSLYLNTLQAKSGSVLFGAVDHAKYEGTLQTVPMTFPELQKPISEVVYIQVLLTQINFLENDKNTTISSNINYNVMLDPRRTLTYVPSTLLELLLQVLNLSYATDYYSMSRGQFYEIPCTNDLDIKLEFDFNGAKIKVPLVDLIIPTPTNTCILGMQNGGGALFLLGNNVLRNGYFVVDLDDKEVSIAQVKITDDEDIEVVSSTVPSAVRIKNYSSTEINIPNVYNYRTTNSERASYPTGSFSVDGDYFSAFWKLKSTSEESFTSSKKSKKSKSSSTSDSSISTSLVSSPTSETTTSKGNGHNLTIGFITSFASLIIGILCM